MANRLPYSCRFGVQYLEDIEDAVQSALLTGLERWPDRGIPKDPTAWLFRVAQNRFLDQRRQTTTRKRLLDDQRERISGKLLAESDVHFSTEVADELLRMLFVCCDEAIPELSRLALALKTLCGFSVGEIAHRLFVTEANIYKRLERAKKGLRETFKAIPELSELDYTVRLPSVHRVLYLLFTEGYLSVKANCAVRRELCLEAIRLARLLADRPVDSDPETAALLALMSFHAARLTGREDSGGGLLLLEEQNRNEWDKVRIREGMGWLMRSARGRVFSRYHAEASIAAEHCMAPSFAETRWDRIVEAYTMLERVTGSPVHRMNRAVALAEFRGAAEGLALLRGGDPPSWLLNSYMWSAVMADLYRRVGGFEHAARFRDAALAGAPTTAIKAALKRRLAG